MGRRNDITDRVLRLLRMGRMGRTAQQIGETLGRPRQQIHNVLRRLEARGLVERANDEGVWRAAPRETCESEAGAMLAERTKGQS